MFYKILYFSRCGNDDPTIIGTAISISTFAFLHRQNLFKTCQRYKILVIKREFELRISCMQEQLPNPMYNGVN